MAVTSSWVLPVAVRVSSRIPRSHTVLLVFVVSVGGFLHIIVWDIVFVTVRTAIWRSAVACTAVRWWTGCTAVNEWGRTIVPLTATRHSTLCGRAP